MSGKKKAYLALLALPLAVALAFSPLTQSADTKGDGKAADAKAAGKGPNRDKNNRGTSPSADNAAAMHLAHQLAVFGDKNKDPLALIAAAKIQQTVGVREGKPESVDDAKAGSAEGKGTGTSTSELLARAKQLAGSRKDLVALADDVAAMKPRGDAIEGPGCYPRRWVGNGGSVFYTVTMRGAEPAVVNLGGSGASDLDLYVWDQYGNDMCPTSGGGSSDIEICRWRPGFTGRFRIEVRNLGPSSNFYQVCTN